MPILQVTLDAPPGVATTNPFFSVNLGHNFLEQPVSLRQVNIISNEPVIPGTALPVLTTGQPSHGLLWVDLGSSQYMSARQVNTNTTNTSDLNGFSIPCDTSSERAIQQVYVGMHQRVNLHDIAADDRLQVQVFGSNASGLNTTTWGTGPASILSVQLVFEYDEISGIN